MPEVIASGVTCHGPQYPNRSPAVVSAAVEAEREELIRRGLWSPQSVNPRGALQVGIAAERARAAAARAASTTAPVVLGVACRVTWRSDPEAVIGCKVPDVGVLPVWELLDPISTPDFTVTRLAAEGEKLPEGLKLFPRAFTETVLPLIARTGPVTPLAEDDPDYAAIVAAAHDQITRQGVANPPKPGIFSQSDHAFERLAEIAVRSYALSIDVAVDELSPYIPYSRESISEKLAELQQDGLARPAYEADVIRAEAARERSRQAAAERARAQNDARLTVKKPHELLIIRRTARASTDFLELAAAGLGSNSLEPVVGDLYRELWGLPGPVAEDMQRPGISILSATVELTDAEYLEKVGAISDKLLHEIHMQRVQAHPATYSEADFAAADARTVQGRYALERFKAKAKELITAGAKGREFEWYADDALFHLPVAFLPMVGLQQAADVIVEALGGIPNGTGDKYIYTSQGYRVERGPARALHAGRIDPATVPDRIISAISAPGPWARGELLPSATAVPAADAARIARTLDKDLFTRAVATAVDGLDEVRVEQVYSALHAAGAIDSITPNASEKARVTACLTHLGYVSKTLGGGRKGPRYRAWVRPKDGDVDEPEAPAVFVPSPLVGPFVRPIVDDPGAPAYVAPVGANGAPIAPAPPANFVRPMVDGADAPPYVAPVNHGPQYPPGLAPRRVA